MKKKQISVLILIIFLFQFKMFSQEKPVYKHLILKITPLAAIDFDNTFQMGLEHRLAKKYTLSEEFGYGRGKDNIRNFDETSFSPFKETYRAKLELKDYRLESPFMTGSYISYEAYYKQVNDKIENTIGRECETGNCNYYEKLNYNVSKYAYGLNIKFGKQIRFGPAKNPSNYVIDYFIGFGLRRIVVDHMVDVDLNDGSSRFNRNSSGIFGGYGRNDREVNLPNITLGLKFGLILF